MLFAGGFFAEGWYFKERYVIFLTVNQINIIKF